MKQETTTVAVRIPQQAYETILRLADDQGKRRSDVLREIICQYVAKLDQYESGK